MNKPPLRRLRVRAPAKINLSLRILGNHPDGYHELRTAFQSLALHDTLTLSPMRGALTMTCDDPACPTDASNLVWRAAERLWRADGRRGRPSGVRIALEKRIPMQAGLGGGSSDAAAALRALARFWGIEVDAAGLCTLARDLGADVAFFFEGGTALGVDRGDLLFPLSDRPIVWVVLVLPGFGVSTKEAYGWWDEAQAVGRRRRVRRTHGDPWAAEWVNDLQAPVVAHHPEIGRIVRGLADAGAVQAAMSGSGSAVFGLFPEERAAMDAAAVLSGPSRVILVTRTTTRQEYERLTRPVWLAGG
jgi:4-diphosphocytidyl-2-C-methyl-D-erythritol kinase